MKPSYTVSGAVVRKGMGVKYAGACPVPRPMTAPCIVMYYRCVEASGPDRLLIYPDMVVGEGGPPYIETARATNTASSTDIVGKAVKRTIVSECSTARIKNLRVRIWRRSEPPHMPGRLMCAAKQTAEPEVAARYGRATYLMRG